MADVSERLRLAAGSLKKQAALSEASIDVLLARIGFVSEREAAAPQGNPSRGGQLAAPAPGGRHGDTGQEPPLAMFEAELAELMELLDRGTPNGGESVEIRDTALSQAIKPDQLRRVAELVELLDGEQAARTWWLRAANAGDRLAAMTCRDLGIVLAPASTTP